MTKPIVEVWIEAEQWAEGEWNPQDDNSDVIVTFDSGEKWIASFFTYANIQSLTAKNRSTGQCLHGAYFWANDMILIDELTRPRIQTVIYDLIEAKEFESVFDRIEEEI